MPGMRYLSFQRLLVCHIGFLGHVVALPNGCEGPVMRHPGYRSVDRKLMTRLQNGLNRKVPRATRRPQTPVVRRKLRNARRCAD
jgi:hypothetical protein